MKIFLRQKAEITTTQLTVFLLTLVGFVILMILFYKFSFSGLVDRESCHQSVILRATMSEIATSVAQGYVPLKCKIKKSCITSKLFGKGDCTEFEKETGIEKVKVENKEDIEKYISQEVLECWQTMGEGKVDLFTQTASNFGFGGVYPTCVICTRIAFDTNSLAKNKIDLTKVNPLEYMEKYKVPGKEESYAKYISGTGTAQVSSADNPIKISEQEFEVQSDSDSSKTIRVTLPEMELPEGQVKNPVKAQELAVLFMQVSAPKTSQVFKNIFSAMKIGVGILGGISLLTAPITTVSKIYSVGSACIGSLPVCAALVGIGALSVGVPVVYGTYSNQELAAGKCEDVLIGGEERNGCSVVRVTAYNEEEISKYCSVIEGLA